MNKILTGLWLALSLAACNSGQQSTPSSSSIMANVYMTNESVQFQAQSQLTFMPNSLESANVLIDDSVRYQQIEGFGAAITDSSAYLLYSLPEPIRSNTLQQLFGSQGIGISLIRVPISASDFSLYNYTYDEMPVGTSDPLLNNFTIFHDNTYIIPLLKMIKAINPTVQIMATPWSAPAWMKTNQSYIGTSNNVVGALLESDMVVYASFLTKAIQGYALNGIEINYMSIQNEPLFAPDSYGGMFMSAQQQSNFINQYLTPDFINNSIKTKVLTYDHNWDHPEYPEYVLSNLTPAAESITTGTAYHCYGGDVTTQSITHTQFPNKSIFMTECSGGDWAPIFGDNLVWDMQNLFIGVLNNWGNGSIKWNIALDQDNGPYVGGCTNCRGLVTVNTLTNAISYNVDYYSVGNMSKFIQPGAYRIASSSSNPNVELTAVKNPAGQIVAMLVNSAKDPQQVVLRWNNQTLKFQIESQSVAAVTWN